LVQGKAVAILKPQAQPRYVEDFKMAKTPPWAERCRFRSGTI